ncbi:enoyl-CoA hydratase/isomerase family protein [Oceanicella actignis]|uniref:enoyl-CoA hydratase/isomerase family protein n=1 Tax=Oceanicella actignis TaxID=1189325 RepID=UPI0011E86037|nr:enoyl-CoA hydratase-related protein [Oceanicella actignis]TYO88913.1 methylglutaconyl-CoA hydratase/isohexenylglutaconyl-CoA hydratase [Oceanicella actignis]
MARSEIEIERDGPWRTVWLSRPQARNALTPQMAAQLREACAAMVAEGARGLTLRGRGGVFCAGGDLKGFAAALDGGLDRAAAERMSREAARLFDEIDALPILVVAAVEGAAAAGGVGLMCVADVAIAAEDARLALTETRLGLSPAQIAPFVLRRTGPAAARRLMLTGAALDAREAQRLGLVDQAVPADRLDAALAAVRAQALAAAPGAVAETKALLRALPGLERAAQIERAARGFARLLTGDEAREGLAAFAARRKPRWALAAPEE